MTDVLGVKLVEDEPPPPLLRRISSSLRNAYANVVGGVVQATQMEDKSAAIYAMVDESNRKLSTGESTGKFIYEVGMTVLIFYSCLSIPFLLAFQPSADHALNIVGAVIGNEHYHVRCAPQL